MNSVSYIWAFVWAITPVSKINGSFFALTKILKWRWILAHIHVCISWLSQYYEIITTNFIFLLKNVFLDLALVSFCQIKKRNISFTWRTLGWTASWYTPFQIRYNTTFLQITSSVSISQIMTVHFSSVLFYEHILFKIPPSGSFPQILFSSVFYSALLLVVLRVKTSIRLVFHLKY